VSVATLWLIGFFVWFNSFPLPNANLQRSQLWSIVPFDLLDLVDPPSEPGSTPWSWSFLLQRIPFLAIAIFVWVVAWAAGSLVLRWLKCQFSYFERCYFAICIGLSCLSLLTLLFGLCGLLMPALFWAVFAVLGTLGFAIERPFRFTSVVKTVAPSIPRESSATTSYLRWIVVGLVVLFTTSEIIGAMTPQNDFDVVEYHLGGPKAWYQQGRITRLPHNVYTNFPFLSEMLLLTGMVLYGDWEWGALAGQAISAGFIPLTALGLFSAGRRWFRSSVGLIAALVYVTSPWTYRISIIAYAEGSLACYLFAALFAVLLIREQVIDGQPASKLPLFPFAILAGLMSGSAMACKYTGLISAVIPCALLLAWIVSRHVTVRLWSTMLSVGMAFSLGLFCSVGPWLAKNVALTGNPVYPLGVRVFGGIDRPEDLDLKWRAAHGAKIYSSLGERLADLPVKMIDVVAKNDWHGPLMFGLAMLSLIWRFRRRQSESDTNATKSDGLIFLVWIYVIWQFATWWVLTHHIDRFYVPMFSAVSLLAGLGTFWTDANVEQFRRMRTTWAIPVSVFVVAGLCYNLTVMLHLGGFNAGRMSLRTALDIATPSRVRWLNEQYEAGRLPANTRILGVGEVELFHARYPYLTNTVFDASILEGMCSDPRTPDYQLLPPAEILSNFRKGGITHIDINWGWILRYREPGNYGYTDFVNPERIQELQRIGILGPALSLPPVIVQADLDTALQQRLEQWGPNLIVPSKDRPRYITGQIFPILDGTRGTPQD